MSTHLLVLGTHNRKKAGELQLLLGPHGFTLKTLAEMPGSIEVDETGTTFAENALIKARSAATSGFVALSDDSGLEVAALGGRPGVYTADWAERQWFEGQPGRDWYMAMGKVEGMLAEIGPGVDRSASFVCTLALVWPDGEELVVEGRAHGSLTWPPRGAMGFGYDPVFVPTGSDLTYAEIDPAEKHAISHRADAFAKLVAAVF